MRNKIRRFKLGTGYAITYRYGSGIFHSNPYIVNTVVDYVVENEFMYDHLLKTHNTQYTYGYYNADST